MKFSKKIPIREFFTHRQPVVAAHKHIQHLALTITAHEVKITPMAKPETQILVCTKKRPEGATKPCCGGKNSPALYRRFKDRIRSHGLRDTVMVVQTGCLKHCSQGITVNIWPQNFWYRDVSMDDVDEILTESVIGGREVKRLRMPDIPWE